MNPRPLDEVWVSFLAGLTPEEKLTLKQSGVNLDNPTNPDPPQGPNRYITNEWWIEKHCVKPGVPEEAGPMKDLLVSVVARVIDAFDCSRSPEVKLHADCMKMALGVPGYKSMGELAKRHDTSKAMISWRVKYIQKRVGLEPSIYMRSEKLCKAYSNARKKK